MWPNSKIPSEDVLEYAHGTCFQVQHKFMFDVIENSSESTWKMQVVNSCKGNMNYCSMYSKLQVDVLE